MAALRAAGALRKRIETLELRASASATIAKRCPPVSVSRSFSGTALVEPHEACFPLGWSVQSLFLTRVGLLDNVSTTLQVSESSRVTHQNGEDATRSLVRSSTNRGGEATDSQMRSAGSRHYSLSVPGQTGSHEEVHRS